MVVTILNAASRTCYSTVRFDIEQGTDELPATLTGFHTVEGERSSQSLPLMYLGGNYYIHNVSFPTLC